MPKVRIRRSFNESRVRRYPAGDKRGGQFAPKSGSAPAVAMAGRAGRTGKAKAGGGSATAMAREAEAAKRTIRRLQARKSLSDAEQAELRRAEGKYEAVISRQMLARNAKRDTELRKEYQVLAGEAAYYTKERLEAAEDGFKLMAIIKPDGTYGTKRVPYDDPYEARRDAAEMRVMRDRIFPRMAQIGDERLQMASDAIFVRKHGDIIIAGVYAQDGRAMSQTERPDILREAQAITKLVNVPGMDKPFDVFVAQVDSGRSYYQRYANANTMPGIVYDPRATRGTFVHEYGHHLECSSPVVGDQARKFLMRRAAGKAPEPTNQVMPYLSETTPLYRDKFEHPYAGKDYGDGTEIVSMGLEQMYVRPYHFAASDPDYFDFIYQIARGYEPEE